MSTRAQEYEALLASWRTGEALNIGACEEALAVVAAFKDPKSLGPLLGLFGETLVPDELLFSVIHAVEAYPDDLYIAELLNSTESLGRSSNRWASIIFMRVLNSNTARAELRLAVLRAPKSIRTAVSHILDDVVQRRPEFAAKAAEVRHDL